MKAVEGMRDNQLTEITFDICYDEKKIYHLKEYTIYQGRHFKQKQYNGANVMGLKDTHVTIFSRYMSRSGISGSCSDSVLHLSNLHTVFLSGYADLHS